MVPSSCTMGALCHLSMYNSAHLHVTCFRTARSRSSWSILSNRPLMSNSRTQSYFQHLLRVTPTASSADFLGPIAIGIRQKDWLQVRLDKLFNNHLGHTICYGRHT